MAYESGFHVFNIKMKDRVTDEGQDETMPHFKIIRITMDVYLLDNRFECMWKKREFF